MSLWNFLGHMKRISYIQDILLKRWLTSLSEIVIYILSNLSLNSKCRSIQTDNYPCVLLHRLLHLIRWCSLKVNTIIDANEVIFQHAQGSLKLWITTLISSTLPASLLIKIDSAIVLYCFTGSEFILCLLAFSLKRDFFKYSLHFRVVSLIVLYP